MSALLSIISQPLKIISHNMHAIGAATTTNLLNSDTHLFSFVRTKVRCYFPRPNEVRRVRRHGWDFRMSTPNGRRIVMRRMLKGRYVLTH